MEFRILGPLEVLEGDRPLPLPGPRQRSLLALLLLHANEVVSSDRLIDELWPEEASESRCRGAPGERLAAAQGARRRRRAARHAAARLRPPLGSDQLDLDRFERSRRGGRPTRSPGGRGEAPRGARALARPCARRVRLRAVRPGGDRPARRASPARAREADRRRPRARPSRATGRRSSRRWSPSIRCARACGRS